MAKSVKHLLFIYACLCVSIIRILTKCLSEISQPEGSKTHRVPLTFEFPATAVTSSYAFTKYGALCDVTFPFHVFHT